MEQEFVAEFWISTTERQAAIEGTKNLFVVLIFPPNIPFRPPPPLSLPERKKKINERKTTGNFFLYKIFNKNKTNIPRELN